MGDRTGCTPIARTISAPGGRTDKPLKLLRRHTDALCMPVCTPRLLRRSAAAVALTGVVAGCFGSVLSPMQTETLDRLNSDRRIYGLRTLPDQGAAQAKAQAWAEKLARENTLYHSNLSDGIRTRWCALGENVGYGSSVAAIETAYMNSPAHRDNILNSRYNGAGVGVARNGDRVFTVQEFITTC